jgi:DNA (cytosine-5)-methyltransferase 1
VVSAPEALILFAGAADGWGVGLKRAGIRPVALAESEPERRAALQHHHPEAVIYEDVRHVTRERLLADLGRLPSIVVGSPPCQDISCANNGRAQGVDGSRSGLYFELVRIVGEVRPDWFAAENAAQLKTRGYDRIHAALEEVGYTGWSFVVGAREAGYFHLRKRSWVAGVDVSDAARKPLGYAGQSRASPPRPSADADQRQQRLEPIPERCGAASQLGDSRAPAAAPDAGFGIGRSRNEGGRGKRTSKDAEHPLPAGLEAIERAARTLGLGGRSRLAEHYRMADGVRSGLARLCISAYGDALVPDIAEAFARVMPQLVAELREGRL